MAYFEMILLVLVTLTGLVLLALAVSTGPVSHLHPTHPRSRHGDGPTARHPSPISPLGTVAVPRTATSRHRDTRRRHRGADWSRLMDGPGYRPDESSGKRARPFEAER